MRYFLYKHIRLDTNKIFYIGMGTVNEKTPKTFISRYKRAYSKSGRSFLWKRIVNCHGYKVIIIKEFKKKENCLKAETRLIVRYGKIIDNTGILANLVDTNEEIIRKLVKSAILTAEKRKIKTYKYSLEGWYIEEYSSMSIAAENNNTLCTDVMLCMRGIKYSTGGFIWKNYKTDKVKSYIDTIRLGKKKVLQFDMQNNFIKEWKGAYEAAKELNISHSAIRNVLIKRAISSNNYKWVYSKEDLTLPKFYLEITNLNTGITKKFYSIVEAEKELSIPKGYISTYMKRNIAYKNYRFKKIIG
jgi:hypothetical protein